MELFSQNFVNATEQITPVKATVKGNLPSWLRGDLIRVGPGKFDMGDNFTTNHWLDGLAIMYKFSIKDNQVTFCKRFVESDAYKKAHKAGRPVYTEFGTKAFPDLTKSLFSRLVSSFDSSCVTDNAGCNIMRIEDEIFVSSETCYMRRIEQNTLDTKEKVDMHKIAGTNFASSHVITDDTGTSYNIGFTIFSGPKYHIMKRSPSNNNTGKDVWLNTRCIATLPSSWKASYSYIHSFGLTENYLVFLEQPLLVNVLRLATSQVKGRSLNDCLEWHPQELVKFIIVSKKTGEVVKTKYISDEPFLVMHHVNAFEVKGQLVVDFVAYPNTDIIEKLYLEKVRNNEFEEKSPSKLLRFVLPLVDDIEDVQEGEELVSVPNCTASAVRARKDSRGDFIQVSGMEIGETGMDMPTFNNERRCKPYRYVYGNGGFDQGYYKNAVCKIDTETGVSQIFKESEYHYPSEPIFVPRPFAAHEEDGVVLVSMVETRKDRPHALVVLDAQSFTEIARIETMEVIPTALHGIFVPEGSGGY
ncbi:UNVERIFIED_CONTAM: hypothetical protein RMT77_002378 [Armadillidium vulgare]